MMAKRLGWSDAFSVGHDLLDAGHRRLIDTINALCAAIEGKQGPKQLRDLADALKLEAADHFGHEDAVLQEIIGDVVHAAPQRREMRAHLKSMSDAALIEHIHEHGRQLTRLDLILRAQDPAIGPGTTSLFDELSDWFVKHAIKQDAHLKTILQAM